MGINSIGASQCNPATVDEQEDPVVQELHLLGQEDGSKVLSDALSGEKLGKGGHAKVYEIPGYRNLLLRSLNRQGSKNRCELKTSQVVFKPVEWPDSIRRNSRLGIALAVAKLDSPANPGGGEVEHRQLRGDSDLLLLRRVNGSTPVGGYYETIAPLEEVKYGHPPILRDLSSFNIQQLDEEKGLLAARYFLKRLEAGEPFEANIDELAGKDFMRPSFDVGRYDYGSSRLVHPGPEFSANYRKFSQAYLQRLEEIAGMPQQAFDQAIGLIVEMNDAHHVDLDFKRHGNNIIIDVEAGKFGFVDLFAGELHSEQKTEALVTQFGECLFGLGSLREFGGPNRMIFLEPDVARLRQSQELICSKLEKAFPGAGPTLHKALSWVSYYKDIL